MISVFCKVITHSLQMSSVGGVVGSLWQDEGCKWTPASAGSSPNSAHLSEPGPGLLCQVFVEVSTWF